MAVVNADYQTVLDACRRCLAYGTQLSGLELKNIIAVVQDASARQVIADAQMVLLQAIDGGATMNTAVDVADTAIVAAATLSVNTRADG